MDEQSLPDHVLIIAAERAETQGDLGGAAQCWQEVRLRFPELVDGYRSGGRILRRLGRFDESVKVLREGSSQFPDDEWIGIDLAWTLHEKGDFVGSAFAWRSIRERFPENVAIYLGGGATARERGAFDEADEIYHAALSRFPSNVAVWVDYAWSAQQRQDPAEALGRWTDLRTRFPEHEEGYLGEGRLLMDLERFEEADQLLFEARERFLGSADMAVSYAWVAHRHGDILEALSRWEFVIANFSQLPDGRRMAAQALMQLERYSEASAVLAPALRMFPNDQEVCVMNGWLAMSWRNYEEAERIWQDVCQRFPQSADGYRGYGLALREMSRLDEADAMLLEGSRRFPDDFNIAEELAQIPERKQDWLLAVQRWKGVVARFPETAASYIGLGNSLSGQGNIVEAEEVFEIGSDRLPDDANLAAARAAASARMGNWTRSLQQWTEVRRRFSTDPVGFLGLGRALRDCGKSEESIEILEDAMRHFPNLVDLQISLALSLSSHRKWERALSLWESLKRDHPGNSDVRWGIAHIIERALTDQASGEIAPFEIPGSLLSEDPDEAENVKRLGRLFARFESLGDTCEFGMVQRMFKVDLVGLLRWSMTSPEDLVMALDSRFEGVGDPEHTRITVWGDEYITEDSRYGMRSHTFTLPSSEPIAEFSVEQCRRIRWLCRKLQQDLSAAQRIFVYKSEDGITDTQAKALFEAVRRYNRDNALFCVRIQDDDHQAGHVERIEDGLSVGYIERFSTVNISVSTWVSLCQTVANDAPIPSNTERTNPHDGRQNP